MVVIIIIRNAVSYDELLCIYRKEQSYFAYMAAMSSISWFCLILHSYWEYKLVYSLKLFSEWIKNMVVSLRWRRVLLYMSRGSDRFSNYIRLGNQNKWIFQTTNHRTLVFHRCKIFHKSEHVSVSGVPMRNKFGRTFD